jgi:hypothetical protein
MKDQVNGIWMRFLDQDGIDRAVSSLLRWTIITGVLTLSAFPVGYYAVGLYAASKIMAALTIALVALTILFRGVGTVLDYRAQRELLLNRTPLEKIEETVRTTPSWEQIRDSMSPQSDSIDPYIPLKLHQIYSAQELRNHFAEYLKICATKLDTGGLTPEERKELAFVLAHPTYLDEIVPYLSLDEIVPYLSSDLEDGAKARFKESYQSIVNNFREVFGGKELLDEGIKAFEERMAQINASTLPYPERQAAFLKFQALIEFMDPWKEPFKGMIKNGLLALDTFPGFAKQIMTDLADFLNNPEGTEVQIRRLADATLPHLELIKSHDYWKAFDAIRLPSEQDQGAAQ